MRPPGTGAQPWQQPQARPPMPGQMPGMQQPGMQQPGMPGQQNVGSTTPDVIDGHLHDCQFDPQTGQGTSSPAGNPPHVHQIVGGMVEGADLGNGQRSEHPGPLTQKQPPSAQANPNMPLGQPGAPGLFPPGVPMPMGEKPPWLKKKGDGDDDEATAKPEGGFDTSDQPPEDAKAQDGKNSKPGPKPPATPASDGESPEPEQTAAPKQDPAEAESAAAPEGTPEFPPKKKKPSPLPLPRGSMPMPVARTPIAYEEQLGGEDQRVVYAGRVVRATPKDGRWLLHLSERASIDVSAAFVRAYTQGVWTADGEAAPAPDPHKVQLAEPVSAAAATQPTPPFQVEIFSAGKWAGLDWSERDLDEMVTNFNKLGDTIKPPLKLGHNDKQVLAQSDGQPALGWVAGLKRVGGKLVATVTDVPTALRESIRQGRYRRVSAEIYPRWDMTSWEKNVKSGVKGKVLSAVALLGAEIPEVKNLQDLARVLAKETGSTPLFFSESCPDGAVRVVLSVAPRLAAGAVDSRVLMYPPTNVTTNVTNTSPTRMPMSETNQQPVQHADELSAMRALIADLDTKVAALTTENVKLSEANANSVAREKIAQQRALEQAAVNFVEKRSTKENFRLFPAQREYARRLFEALDGDGELVTATEGAELKLFGEGEQPRALTARDCLARLIDSWPNTATVLASEMAVHTAGPAVEDFDGAFTRIMLREKYDRRNPEHIRAATQLVAQERPDLVSDYGRKERVA